MRIAFVKAACLGLAVIGLAGCQTIYDYFAEDSCYDQSNTPGEERACLDSVDQNSRDHSD